MTAPPDIRELSQRAELEFHARPHRFRRRSWWLGVILALGCCGWLLYAAIIGDHRLYEAGPLSASHAFIANDCRQCHTSWQPAHRLVSGGASVSSIDNAACVKCHAASEHHPNQIPAHAELSCAECHREHQGTHELAAVTDRHCVRCHRDLQTKNGPSQRFARNIRGFSHADGHPEFNLRLRLSSPAVPSNLVTAADLKSLFAENPTAARYQQQFLDVLSERLEKPHAASSPPRGDRGEIKFNHAAHLDPLKIRDKTGRHVDLSQNCRACHVPDAAGQYMQPIRYERHCAQCHPLLFDNQHYPGEVVPHADPQVVRGFLTEKFTLAALKRNAPLDDSQVVRPLPGRADPEPLDADGARRLDELVAQAERMAQDHGRAVKSRGGCKLCHTVSEPQDNSKWSIAPTQIPDRWLPHSQFDHAAHRMLNCAECHGQVTKSKDTADVLVPGIAECRTCHISASTSPRITPGGPSLNHPGPAVPHDVQSSCVMCHSYHRRDENELAGQLDSQLRSEKK